MTCIRIIVLNYITNDACVLCYKYIQFYTLNTATYIHNYTYGHFLIGWRHVNMQNLDYFRFENIFGSAYMLHYCRELYVAQVKNLKFNLKISLQKKTFTSEKFL